MAHYPLLHPVEWLQDRYEEAPDELLKLHTIYSSFKMQTPLSDTTGRAE